MNLNLKKLTIYIFLATFVVGLIVFAGSLIPSVDTTQSNFVTLEDIYQRTQHFDYVLPSTHDISYSSSATGTMHTINDIKNSIKSIMIPDVSDVKAGVTYGNARRTLVGTMSPNCTPGSNTNGPIYTSATTSDKLLPSTAPESTMVTLEEMYQRIYNFDFSSTSVPAHDLSTSSNPSGSMHTLQDIWNAMQDITLPNPSEVRQGTYYGQASNPQIGTLCNLSIGADYQGGKIAYILQPGDLGYAEGETRGLIAAPVAESTGTTWGCEGTTITGADGIAIGTGYQNTLDILANCSTTGIAAKVARDYTGGGYTDWYLPSKNELNQLYLNQSAIGGFSGSGDLCWSSSESSASQAWVERNTGQQGASYKSLSLCQHAIRTFGMAPLVAPNSPIDISATSSDSQATITFAVPASDGGSAITGYTVTSSPAGGVDTNAGTTGLSHLVTGLTNGTPYTFTVTATNAIGTSVASAASNSVTPNPPPFACGTSVDFTYKGSPVTYGTIFDGTNCWLDRNLGAGSVGSYGDLFQWGRLDDGHQDRGSGSTDIKSTTDVPGHSNFIYVSSSPYDWRNPSNNSLWQGVSGINNPCPSGWRIPSSNELYSAVTYFGVTNCTNGPSSPLAITCDGLRTPVIPPQNWAGLRGKYWTYSVSGDTALSLQIDTSISGAYERRSDGESVRCIKN